MEVPRKGSNTCNGCGSKKKKERKKKEKKKEVQKIYENHP